MIQEQNGRKFQRACRIWFCPTDDKIAMELRKMPQEEREKVWADLSGNEKTSMFRQPVKEDPKAIDEALVHLQREIEGTKEKTAFDLAQRMNPNYVKSRSFQLAFLRSCEYDGKRAGRLLIDHMETKRLLFGNAVLGRDIRLSDLNSDDMVTLSTGGFQFLRERDSAGRIVLYYHRGSLKFKERENFVSFFLNEYYESHRGHCPISYTRSCLLVWPVARHLLCFYDCVEGRISTKTWCCGHLGFDVEVSRWS